MPGIVQNRPDDTVITRHPRDEGMAGAAGTGRVQSPHTDRDGGPPERLRPPGEAVTDA
jgi:hypothetical protein